VSSNTRVYHLEDSGRRILVRGVSSAQSISFVARSRFPCRVATLDDMEAVLSAGGRVYDATDPAATLPPIAPQAAAVVPVGTPTPSVAMNGVSSVDDVLRILAPVPVADAAGEGRPDAYVAAADAIAADAAHHTKLQGETA